MARSINLALLVLILLVAAALVSAFAPSRPFLRYNSLLRAKVEVGDSASVADGKSIVVKTAVGEVIVANLKGKFYAVNAKCPHLGKSMKIGKIADGASGPTITCNFHDACFSLKNGKCSAWATNVGLVDRMKPSGAENSPATVYPCSVEKGKLVLNL